MNSKNVLRFFASLGIFYFCMVITALPMRLFAEDSAQPTVGQKAVSAVLKQVTIDPTALAPKTGKPLPADGAWSIGKEAFTVSTGKPVRDGVLPGPGR
ncbi:hypothetical protein [Granulicella sp. L60]|uniref:hypothetical protein n=1 Tax=Granulicella sp. L60 TaxID=1641866 RepID=UPI00131AF4C4|nr:hypothetical protein [Granulicella sp. L60]